MIPRSIRREHILMAIREVDGKGVPKERQSRKFLLEHIGRYYPPKYVVSLASRYATGRELRSSEFNGGKEINDFLTSLGFNIIGLSSTKRKASVSHKRENEHDACSRLKSHEGVEKAQKMADGHRWRSEVREDEDPIFGRVVIAGEWGGEPERARALLEEVCSRWPNGRRVRFLITCGGFIQFGWPRHIDQRDIGDSIHPSKDAVSVLVKEAEGCIRSVLGGGLDKRLGKLTDYITLGVDSHKGWASATGCSASPHIELVFLIDLRSGRLYWTGKSYPTLSQQKGLVRIADLKTHFLDLDVGKVMLLGCHDLTIFNPRSKNAKGWRKETNEGLRKLAVKERPAYVLHHPHTAVKVRTWLNAWSNLRRTLPSVRSYASAGRYHEPNRDPSEYDDLSYVLKSTKRGGAIDLIAYL